VIRNLLYNVYAPTSNDEWRLNVDKLNTYSSVFSGRKIVLVKTGPRLVSPDSIQAAFAFDAEFVLVPNNTKQQEGAGFLDALEMLHSLRDDEATFYAHTKGVRYDSMQEHQLRPLRRWRDEMYEHCLGEPSCLDEVLKHYACCGCFRLLRDNHPTMLAPWHFSGTFWWVKHSALFATNWREMIASIYGVENYLGNLIPVEQSFCLYSDNSPPAGRYSASQAFRCLGRRCGFVFEAVTGVHLHPQKHCPECGSVSVVVDHAAL